MNNSTTTTIVLMTMALALLGVTPTAARLSAGATMLGANHNAGTPNEKEHKHSTTEPSEDMSHLPISYHPSSDVSSLEPTTATRDDFAVFSSNLDRMEEFLFQMDTTALPEDIQPLVIATREELKKAKEAAADIPSFMVTTEKHMSHASKAVGRGLLDDTYESLALTDGKNEEQDTSSSHKDHQNSRKNKHQQQKKKKKKTDHFSKFKAKFNTNHRANSHFDLHEAIMMGDMSFVESKLHHMAAKMDAHLQEGRKLMNYDMFGNAVIDKKEMCTDLVECVFRMSLYDLFTFFYADDLDNNDGTMDGYVDNFDAHNIFDKRDMILEKLYAAQGLLMQASPTFQLGDACDELLQQFHRNEEFKDPYFVKWHGSSVVDVCRGRGSTDYVSFEWLNENEYTREADDMFEDLVKCSGTLHKHRPTNVKAWADEDFVFYHKEGNARQIRVPKGINNDLKDQHGLYNNPANVQINDFYRYELVDNSPKINFNKYAADMIVWDFPILDYAHVHKCLDVIREVYPDHYFQNSESVTMKNPYGVELIVHCEQKSSSQCSISLTPSDPPNECEGISYSNGGFLSWEMKSFYPFDDYCFYTAPNGTRVNSENRPSEGGLSGYTVTCKMDDDQSQLIFRDTETSYDDAMSLVFGADTSVGLVCAFADEANDAAVGGHANARVLPGYCCLDNSYSDQDTWGRKHSCDSTCTNYAPYFAGFSQEACDVFSGTFCYNPVDCSELQKCVSDAKNVSLANNNTAFHAYLEASSPIDDPTDLAQCQTAKEYFGFDSDEPREDMICEEIERLRNTKDFSALDEFVGGGGGSGPPGDDDDDDYEPEGLVEPAQPEFDSDLASSWGQRNFALSQSVYALEQVFDIISAIECPADFTGVVQTLCSVAKALSVTVARLSLYTVTTVLAISEYSYGNAIQLGDFQMNQMFKNVEVLYGNMVVTYDQLLHMDGDLGKLKEKIESIQSVQWEMQQSVNQIMELLGGETRKMIGN